MSDSNVQSDFISVETEIIAVTVYSEQARVTRRGQLTVQPGKTVLDIGPLPAVVETKSIQAYTQGSAQVILQKPYLESLTQDSACRETEATLGDRVHYFEERFRTCKDHLAGLNQQQSFLQSLAEHTAQEFAQGLSQQSITLENVSDFTSFFEKSYQRNAEAIAALERRKHELDVQLQQARQALQLHQAQANQQKYRILLPVEVQHPGELELNIVYDVVNASWRPAYHVRLQKDDPSLQLNCIAEVQQSTGEHWHQVALKVSTAAPEKTPAIPDVRLLRLPVALQGNAAEPAPAGEPKVIRSRSRILEEPYRMLGAVPGSEIPPQMEDDGLMDGMWEPANAIVCFSASSPVVVQSDGAVHSVPVGELKLDSQFTYVALPQYSSAAYLCADLTNPTHERPLLPGMAYLFRDGGYVGAEEFKYVAPGQSFKLSLGLDQRVNIQRELIPETTCASPTTLDSKTYRLTLHNPFNHAIEVTVIEQMPVSRSEDIQVQLVSSQPETLPDRTSQCQWLIRLEAQDSRHISYQYAVVSALEETPGE